MCLLSHTSQTQRVQLHWKLLNCSQYTHECCTHVDGHIDRNPDWSTILVHVHVGDNVCQCVCSAICMLHYTTWQAQSPVGWHCCILHLAEHIQHIRGVTNPFLTARTFQRVSVPANNTSSGFHTSELMCVWHTEAHRSTQKCVAMTKRLRCVESAWCTCVCKACVFLCDASLSQWRL